MAEKILNIEGVSSWCLVLLVHKVSFLLWSLIWIPALVNDLFLPYYLIVERWLGSGQFHSGE